MATEPVYVDQSPLYSKADGISTGKDDEKNVVPTIRGSRSFFIIDKSKMVSETDTVEGAKVVYLPENELEKSLYQSRCSCLIGVADAYRNFTGTLPQFFTMSGASYACKLLEPNYFMFLLGRLYEPGERVLHSLQLIYDIFHFYYHSPGAVMTKSLGDWETFTANMKFIFSKINDFVFRDTHSISFMFPTLPYSQSAVKKRRSRHFMSASRILRSCQQHKSIIGGCIMHNTEILCNQLSPELMGKLQVVGGQGIELNTKSILAENVAPETVWVLEVYLTPEEVESLQNMKKDVQLYQTVYHNMTPNLSLVNNPCTVPSRFQSPSSRSSSKPGKRTTKLSGWRSHTTPRVANTAPIDDDDDYYNLPPITDTRADSSSETDRHGLQSLRSDDSALFKPDTSTVSIFSRKSWKTSRSTQSKERDTVEAASGSKDAREREQQQGRERTASSRTMPQLHNKVERRHFPYDDPDKYLDTPSVGGSSSAHQTQGGMTAPPNKDSSDYSDLPSFPIAPTAKLNKGSSDYSNLPSFPITSSGQLNEASPEYSNLPSLPTAPISLSIPIAGGKQTEASSPLLSVGGSSVEEERFATPSPNFPSLLTPQPSTMDIPPKLELSSCVDQSNSFQTATKPSHSSSKTQSPTYNTNAYESSSIPPLRPPAVITSTPISHSSKQASIEEDDFMDADTLDQLIAESRQLKAVQVSINRGDVSSDTGDGIAEVTEGEVDKRNRPLPALPLEDDDAPTGSDVEHLPPPLPPRGQSQDTTDENQQLNPSSPEFKIKTDLHGESGEFSITPLSSSAKQLSTEHRVENNSTESTSPLSPQKTHNEGEEGWVSEQCTSDKTPSEPQVEEENPSMASPRDNLDLLTVEDSSKDPLGRSRSSSPDHQHRELTQLGMQEAADGTGELEDMQGEEESPEEFPRKKCPSTSVDPREEGEMSNEEGLADEVTDGTYPAPILMTSDEEESGEESTVDISKTATLLHSHPPFSKDGVLDDSASVFDSVPRARLMGTPESANVSINQLFTPETTLQISAVQDLQNPRVTVTDTSSVLLDDGKETQTVADASDMGMPRPRATSRIHTLGRQLQPPEVAPTPQLETYCLYVQRQFNTMVVLVAKKGLHNDHSLLTTMWKGLAQQLFALDQGFQSVEEQDKEQRSPSILAVYQNTDQFCAAEIQKAPYKFRHAIRCMHLEYQKDPDLCQVTLILNGSCKMVSQKVMERETFFDYYKSQASDVFSTAAQTTKGARQNSHRLIAGGTPAQFL